MRRVDGELTTLAVAKGGNSMNHSLKLVALAALVVLTLRGIYLDQTPRV